MFNYSAGSISLEDTSIPPGGGGEGGGGQPDLTKGNRIWHSGIIKISFLTRQIKLDRVMKEY